MIWIPITLLAAVLQTARNGFQRALTGVLSPLGATYTRFLFGLPFAAIYAAALYAANDTPLPAIPARFIAGVVIGGIAQIAATACLLHLFRMRNFATGIVLSKSEIVLAAVFGFAVLGDAVSPVSAVAILVATAALVLLARGKAPGGWRDLRAGAGSPSTWLGLACGAGFAVGTVSYRAASLSLAHVNYLEAAALTLAISTFLQSIFFGAFLAWREPGQVREVVRQWRRSVLPGFTGAAASACWFTAMTIEPVVHVRMLGLVEVLFGFGVSAVVLKERPTRLEIIGAAVLVLGILVLLWDRAR